MGILLDYILPKHKQWLEQSCPMCRQSVLERNDQIWIRLPVITRNGSQVRRIVRRKIMKCKVQNYKFQGSFLVQPEIRHSFEKNRMPDHSLGLELLSLVFLSTTPYLFFCLLAGKIICWSYLLFVVEVILTCRNRESASWW